MDGATKETAILVDDGTWHSKSLIQAQDFDSEILEIPGLTLPQPRPLQTLGCIQDLEPVPGDRDDNYRRVDEGDTNGHPFDRSSNDLDSEMEIDFEIPGLVLALSGSSPPHNLHDGSNTRNIPIELPNDSYPNRVVDPRNHSQDQPKSVDGYFTANAHYRAPGGNTLDLKMDIQPQGSSTVPPVSSASPSSASSLAAANPLKRLRDVITPNKLAQLSQPVPDISAPNLIHSDRTSTSVQPEQHSSPSSSDCDISDSASEPEYGSYTFNRTPPAHSVTRDPLARPSTAGVVGLPPTHTKSFLGHSQTMDTKKRPDYPNDEDSDSDMDTTSDEDVPIKSYPFTNPVKRPKTSHQSITDRTGGGNIKKQTEDLRVDGSIKAERDEYLSTHLDRRASSVDRKGKGRETKTVLGLSLPSPPNPLPMKKIPPSSCTIPEVRLGRARRVLVPGPRYKAEYPLATVAMKGDVQFVDRKTRKWHGAFSIPNGDNLPLNVQDACIVDDIIVLAYNSGPYQLGTIRVPPINSNSQRPTIVYSNPPSGFRAIRTLAPVVSNVGKYAITTDSEKTVRMWDVDVSLEDSDSDSDSHKPKSKTKLKASVSVGAKPAKIGVLPHIATALAVRGSELLYSRGKVLCIMNDIYRLPGRLVTGGECDSAVSIRELANEITHIHVPLNSGEKNLVIIETDHPRTQIGVYDTRKNIRVYGEDIAFGYTPGSFNLPPQQKTTRMETTKYFRGGPDTFGSPDTYKFVRGYSDGVVCLFDLRNAQAPVRISARRDESSRSKAVFHATFGSFCVDHASAPTRQSSAGSSMKRHSSSSKVGGDRPSSRTSSKSSDVKGKHMVKGIVTFGGKELDFLDLELNAY